MQACRIVNYQLNLICLIYERACFGVVALSLSPVAAWYNFFTNEAYRKLWAKNPKKVPQNRTAKSSRPPTSPNIIKQS